MRKLALFIFLLSPVFLLKANNTNAVFFTENKNQWQGSVLYKASLDGGSVFLEKNKLLFNFYDKEARRAIHGTHNKDQDQKIRSHAFEVNFLNSSLETTIGKNPATHYNNYFIGKDSKKWASNVKNYNEVIYHNLYSGIDLQLLGLSNSIKYNFYVQPRVSPSIIQLQYNGVDSVFIDRGQLNIITSLGTILEQEPFAYQFIDGKRIKVTCKFVLNNKTLSFELGNYNKNYELIIDPILVFCSYSGSTADNFGTTATPDHFGNLVAGGITFDNGYPVTLGAYDSNYDGSVQNGICDVVLTKYNNNGSNLIFSTYLGGKGTENVNSLIVNQQNELLLYGVTGSVDFPVTETAFDTTYNGGPLANLSQQGNIFYNGTDIYVTKISANGSSLLASTYIGGSANDGLNVSTDLNFNYGDALRGEIMLDKYGEVYVASCTASSDFPITSGVIQTHHKGNSDACVFKFNANLTSLVWSTFLGGDLQDAAYSLAVNDSLQVYVAGGTNSINYPTTSGVLHTSFQGGRSDGFISILNKEANALINSTYIGTSAYDQNYFIQIDSKGMPYVLGQTQAFSSYTITPGVYSNPNSGIFITKLNYALTSYTFSTLLGSGSNKIDLSPTAFLIDNCETIYFSGWGGNILTGIATTNMPLTSNPHQSTTDGFNFYLMRLEKNASSLSYATYFGSPFSRDHVDGGTSRFDKRGVVYQSVCASCGGDTNGFPTTPGAWSQTDNSPNCNNGVFKFDFEQTIATANITSESFRGCSPFTIQFFNAGSGFTNYQWDFGNGDVTSTDPNPTRTYTIPGIYQVKLIVENPLSCNIRDTNYIYVEVVPPLNVDFDFLVTDCGTKVEFVDQTTGSDPATLSYNWDFGNGVFSNEKEPKFDFENAGTFNIKLVVSSSLGCADSAEIHMELGKTSITKDTILCTAGQLQLFAEGGIEYTWQPATKLNDNKIGNPIATINETTTFTCLIKTADSGGNPCTVSLSTIVYLSQLQNISLTASKDTILNKDTIQLTATPVGNYVYSWKPLQTLSNFKIYNPLAFPSETTNYTVKIADQLGCLKDAEIKVVVLDVICKEPYVFIPNTFTPNQDNNNDLFRVRGEYIFNEEFYFAIYNRWGEMLFETKDPLTGWDGTYKNKRLDPDVYAYYIKLKCIDGEEFFKKGNITLLK